MARLQLRRRLIALATVALLVGVAGGAVASAVALQRRTSTVYDRLVAATGPADAQVNVFFGGAEQVADLPGVETSWTVDLGVAAVADSRDYMAIAGGDDPAPDGLVNVLPVQGRLPDPDATDEIAVDQRLIEGSSDSLVGTQLDLHFLSQEDFRSFDTGFEEPGGPTVGVEVVGSFQLPGTTEDSPPAIAGPGFVAAHPDALAAGEVMFVTLTDGAAGVPALQRQLEELSATIAVPEGAEEFSAFDVTIPEDGRTEVTATADVISAGLLAFAAAAALAAVVVLVQAGFQLQASAAPDLRVARALGMSRADRVRVQVLTLVPVAATAALVTAAMSVWTAALEPMGSLHGLEPAPGRAVNVAVVAAVVGGVALAVLAVGVATAVLGDPQRSDRRRAPHRVRTASGMTGSPSGIAWHWTVGPGSRPLRSAVLGLVVAIAGVVAGLVFTASLDRLQVTPERFGWGGDFAVIDADDEVIARITSDPDVEAATLLTESQASLDGHVGAVAASRDLKGSAGWTVLTGVRPTAADEVMLGSRRADALGVDVGDQVETDGATLTVVGIGIGPTFGSQGFASGAIVTDEGLAAIESTGPFRAVVVRAAPGVDPTELLGSYGDFETDPAHPPPAVRNLGELGRLPELLVAFLALLGAAALTNALVVVVRQRRRDLGVLRVLGHTPRQTRATVGLLGLLAAVAGLIVGVPLGLAIGRTVWRQVADGAFVAGDPLFRWGAVALVVVACLVVAVVIAAVPAVRAGRDSPAAALRTE